MHAARRQRSDISGPADPSRSKRGTTSAPPRPKGTTTDRERVWRQLEKTLGESLTRIARDSHDALFDARDPELSELLRSVRKSAIEGLQDLQSVREAIDRETLREQGLTTSLRTLAHRFQATTGIFTELRLPRDVPAVSDEAEWALHVVTEEALEGLARRSRATGVLLDLRASEDEITLAVRDDGIGLMARQGAGWRATPHVTVRAMTRAVEYVGGSVDVTTVRPRGILVRAVVPLHQESSDLGTL
jgi:signal transduction histidine kinase